MKIKKELKDTLTFISILFGIFLIWSSYTNYLTLNKIVDLVVLGYFFTGIISLGVAIFLQKSG